MTRRAPEAVLTALEMDPARRELYVEGPSDRLLIAWLATDCQNDDVVIQDVDALEMIGDGSKDRLVRFAKAIGNHDRICVFVDADRDGPGAITGCPCLITTDFRDSEGYLLTPECFDKLLRVGLSTDSVTGSALLAIVLREARKVGLLREVSAANKLKLPFRRTELYPAVTATSNSAVVNVRQVASRLLANSPHGTARLAAVMALFQDMERTLVKASDLALTHGKDAVAVLAEILRKHGVAREDTPRLLRLTIERGAATDYPNLRRVLEFVCRP